MFVCFALLTSALHALPHTLPPPRLTEVGGCAHAACTSDEHTRVCTCVPTDTRQAPGVTVDVDDGTHLEWDSELVESALADFVASASDLDRDGALEWVVSSRAGDQGGYDVVIVDGHFKATVRARSSVFAADSTGPQTILLIDAQPADKLLIGREYVYANGRLEPASVPARCLKIDAQPLGELVRQAMSRGTVCRDEPSRGVATAVIAGVSRVDDQLSIYLQLNANSVVTLSVASDAERPLRLGNAQKHALYPERYVPFDAENWLSSRVVKVLLENGRPVGPLWLEAPVPVRSK